MQEREQWASKLGFILSAAGSAIGLGAIWKFPYITGQNGGGAFLMLFLLFTILIGLPLLLAEFSIGRAGGGDALTSYKRLAPKTPWFGIGILGLVTCFILLSFYSVIGGWIVIYLFKAATGSLAHVQNANYDGLFASIIANPTISLSMQFIFMLITIIVVAKGVQKGIERMSKIMMPALAILFFILVVRSLTLPHAIEGVRFLLQPDFGKVSSQTILEAMGQSFFTLSLGVSVMVTYSSYLSKKESLPKSAISIVIMNIAVVLLAGLAIFPAVFSFGMKPDAGPVLLFHVLPSIFSQLPFGMFFFFLFLVVFLFAALTSGFSMLEMIVAIITKGDPNKRRKWSWIIGLGIFIVGIPSALSYGLMADFKIFGKTFFDLADYAVSNVLMPIGTLLIAIFVSWIMKKSTVYEELSEGSEMRKGIFQAWYFLLRYIIPILIIVVMVNVLRQV
ncbi:sodium-dependent transporter [Aciduricibacillus chroicocephali]|uniref:Transporter n=1 Tax=Aciduricibacillus chroicocephali TaxID=3054939 RepID=A0ABY9KX35_9BACI|nr:sodium-dependent transporter [Bacillaceae bacterium 44XB]